jgi:hypothetical protein
MGRGHGGRVTAPLARKLSQLGLVLDEVTRDLCVSIYDSAVVDEGMGPVVTVIDVHLAGKGRRAIGR